MSTYTEMTNAKVNFTTTTSFEAIRWFSHGTSTITETTFLSCDLAAPTPLSEGEFGLTIINEVDSTHMRVKTDYTWDCYHTTTPAASSTVNRPASTPTVTVTVTTTVSESPKIHSPPADISGSLPAGGSGVCITKGYFTDTFRDGHPLLAAIHYGDIGSPSECVAKCSSDSHKYAAMCGKRFQYLACTSWYWLTIP